MQPKYYGAAANYNKSPGGINGLSGILKIFGIFVGVIILLTIGLTVVGSITKGPQDDFARLVVREAALKGLLDKQKGHINNGDLRTINATAFILTTGDISTTTALLKSIFSVDGVPDDISAAEADTTSENALKNALLVGTFDKTYVGILHDKIAATYSLAKSITAASNSDNIKAAMQQVTTNLSTIDAQLAALNLQ